MYFALEMKKLKDDYEHFEIFPPLPHLLQQIMSKATTNKNFVLQNLNENQNFVLQTILNLSCRWPKHYFNYH